MQKIGAFAVYYRAKIDSRIESLQKIKTFICHYRPHGWQTPNFANISNESSGTKDFFLIFIKKSLSANWALSLANIIIVSGTEGAISERRSFSSTLGLDSVSVYRFSNWFLPFFQRPEINKTWQEFMRTFLVFCTYKVLDHDVYAASNFLFYCLIQLLGLIFVTFSWIAIVNIFLAKHMYYLHSFIFV